MLESGGRVKSARFPLAVPVRLDGHPLKLEPVQSLVDRVRYQNAVVGFAVQGFEMNRFGWYHPTFESLTIASAAERNR